MNAKVDVRCAIRIQLYSRLNNCDYLTIYVLLQCYKFMYSLPGKRRNVPVSRVVFHDIDFAQARSFNR